MTLEKKQKSAAKPWALKLKGAATERIRKEVQKAQEKVSASSSVLPSLRNREVIALLEEEGIFQIKDSVTLVADCLGISKNTVYLHLRTIRQKN